MAGLDRKGGHGKSGFVKPHSQWKPHGSGFSICGFPLEEQEFGQVKGNANEAEIRSFQPG